MTVVYLDSVFALNALTDYLLLLAAARLAGLPLRRGRYILSALLGGFYAAAVFLPGGGFLAGVPVKIAIGVLLSLVAFGGQRHLLRMTLLFFILSCGLAGCVLAVGLLSGVCVPMEKGVFYTNVNGWVLLVAATGAYLVLTAVFRASASAGVEGLRLPVRICLDGHRTEGIALWDSGNGLRGLHGEPVLVVSDAAWRHILPPKAREAVGADYPADVVVALRALAPELQPLLLPYSAVGVRGGLLPAVRSDWTEIAGRRYVGLYLAGSPTELGEGYLALWGGEGGKRHGKGVAQCAAAAADAAGAFSGGKHSLHRRERHPAAAADPGTGGRTPAASGRGDSSPRGY